MHGTYLRCIGHGCGLEYPIGEKRVECDKGHLLDVVYSDTPTFQSRRNLIFLMKVEYGDTANF